MLSLISILKSGAYWTLIQQLWYQLFFYSHLATGIFALVLGAFQFSSTIRLRMMKVHRWMGKIYVLTALWCSASGVVIGAFAHGGWFNALGFMLLGVCWFFTTYKGFTTIRKGDVEAHRIWMIRSYACAFAAVTLRIWLLTYPLLGLDFETAYQYVSWVSWLLNMGVAELIIYFQIRSHHYEEGSSKERRPFFY